MVVYSTWLVYQDGLFFGGHAASGRPGSFGHTPDDPGGIVSGIRDTDRATP